ncbi:hypothetical protein J9874_00428 [Duffyella gerundensis]|nr:hypothetical protein J9874_00428 [Duffyella gerundensis]
MQDRTRLVSKRGFISGSQQGKIIKREKNKSSKRNKNYPEFYCKKGLTRHNCGSMIIFNSLFFKSMQPHRFFMRLPGVSTSIYL